jgi:hypothetical protein
MRQLRRMNLSSIGIGNLGMAVGIDKSMRCIGRKYMISIWIQCNVFVAVNYFYLLKSAEKSELRLLRKILDVLDGYYGAGNARITMTLRNATKNNI